MGKRLGTFRAFYLAALCCVGSFLFAYDTGVVGGVLTFDSFKRDFGIDASNSSTVSGLSASLLQAGAFVACFFIWPFTAKYGRRWSLVLASAIFNVGAVVQTINTHSLAAFYVARVISGVGVGMATVIIPMYSAEMAPKEIRGQMGSMFQFFFTIGVAVSYWVDYGVSINVPSITKQWQIPIGLQLVPGGILGLGMLLTKESTRWLAKKGQTEKALESLIWVRGGDSSEVQAEFNEILAGIRLEEHMTEGVTWREVLMPTNRKRLAIIISADRRTTDWQHFAGVFCAPSLQGSWSWRCTVDHRFLRHRQNHILRVLPAIPGRADRSPWRSSGRRSFDGHVYAYHCRPHCYTSASSQQSGVYPHWCCLCRHDLSRSYVVQLLMGPYIMGVYWGDFPGSHS